MKEMIFYSALIDAIEKLYFRVALIVLHKRIDGYRKKTRHGINSHDDDIKLPLLECITEIIGNDQNSPAPSHAINYSILVNSTTNLHLTEKYNAVGQHVINKENVGELSRYFKARSKGSVFPPGIEEKLKHGTWEHIHAAIRYARKADMHNAKMHADIASSACKELAHYMSEEHYQGFLNEIEMHLNVLKPSKQTI